MTQNKKLTIGLFGFGVVGEGIYKVLLDTPSLNAEIKKICIKQPNKLRDAPESLFTTDPNELLNDEEINVIVELIDDHIAAYQIVSIALKNKKAVVSANKRMIAANLDELLKLQKQYEVSFLYEAAVCGSVPVIRNLEEYYDNDLLNSFSGIINGSTNFILTKMKEDFLSYDEALKEAQILGFVESDPSLDVSGKDAVNKLTIVLKHAYGITADPETILSKGINYLHPLDSKYAKEKGFNIKLVANAKRIGGSEIAAWVLPTLVPANSQLYAIRNEFNGVLIGSKLADEQFLYGKGAGRYPTSSAVLSDIAALRYNYRYEYKKSNSEIKYQLSNNYLLKVFVSFSSSNEVNENDFVQIEETFRSVNRQYLIGNIGLTELRDAKWFNSDNVSVVVIGDSNALDSEIQIEETEYAQ